MVYNLSIQGFCQFSIGSELKIQICLGSLIYPEMDFQQHP
jgi:hypothetical protein